MKANNKLWNTPNLNTSNQSGFSSLPEGFREYFFGNFHLKGYNAFYWSATKADSLNAWIRSLSCSNGLATRSYADIRSGFSIRCLKDDE
jgi:uncharacterized protein (TIGR02145 family)